MSSPEQRHSLMQQARKPRSVLAGQEGLEPPTTGFGDRDSGQLSYCPLPDGLTSIDLLKPSAAAGSPRARHSPCGRAWSMSEPPPVGEVYVAGCPGVEPRRTQR